MSEKMKTGFVPLQMTEAGELVGFKIDTPNGETLLIKCAGGTTPEEAWDVIQYLTDSANAVRDVLIKAGKR